MKSRILTLRTAALLGATIVGSISTPAFAGEDEQLWLTANVNVKLTDSWRLQQEVVTRLSDNRKGLYEIESVTLLGYRLAKNVTLAAGYVHDPQYAGGDFKVMERRAREQVTFDNFVTLGPGKLTGRLRFEQRWRDHISGTGWRMRPYLKYSMPLVKGSKTSLVLTSEPFFNFNRTAFQGRTGLDRVRNFVGINTPLNKKVNVEVGYLNQHGFVRGGKDTSDHVASLALNVSL